MGLGAFLLSLAVGTVLGTLSGLGIGGGSLLILWLTGPGALEAEAARTVSLLFFLPAALLACFRRRKQLSLQSLLPGILSGCAAAVGFSYLNRVLDPGLFRRAYGVLLLIIGISEISFKKQK